MATLRKNGAAITAQDRLDIVQSLGLSGSIEIDLASGVGAVNGLDTSLVPGTAFSIAGEDGRTALEVKDDGEVEISSLTVSTINGIPFATLSAGSSALEGDFTAELNYILNTGQSLAQISIPSVALTTVQEYDNIGFPWAAVSPASYLPLTVANTQYVDGQGVEKGESPMYGTLGHIKALILAENGLAHTQHKYQLLTCNNGRGGTSITQHVKGTAFYSDAMSQVQAAYNIAQAEGRSFVFQAFTWTQGEADAGTMSRAAYTTTLRQMVADFNSDAKAITGQTEDVICICYQLSGETNRDVAMGQMDAAEQDPLIHMACPTYFFTRGDGTHLTADSSKWMGAYYGLVYKRVKVDKVGWTPVSVKSITKQGAVLNIVFNAPKLPLVFDTTAAAHTNYGFSLVDSAGSALSIAGVELIQRDTVRIRASATIPVGAKLRYGFLAGNGNLRDSQGDTLVYAALGDRPMHNWCIIFEKPL